jgi:sulfoxide reductase heme-binding subunit YedZ
MSLLAITSNDWSVKLLKKKWSKIHQLTYLLVFILPWHILDKMSYSWDYLTPLAVLICFIFICLFIHRKILEWKKHLQAE